MEVVGGGEQHEIEIPHDQMDEQDEIDDEKASSHFVPNPNPNLNPNTRAPVQFFFFLPRPYLI